MRIFSALLLTALFATTATANLPQQLANLQLIDGWSHHPLQGIDSVVGELHHEDGSKLHYEIGRVTEPGAPPLGGDYRNNTQQQNIAWKFRQTIANEPVDIGYATYDALLISFPNRGINFTLRSTNAQRLQEATAMALTVPLTLANE